MYHIESTSNSIPDMDTIDIVNLFDNDINTYWKPYPNNNGGINTKVIFDFYLSPISMTDDIKTGWDITQISFDWRFEFDSNNLPIDKTTQIYFDIYFEDNNTTTLYEIEYPNNVNYYESLVSGPSGSETRQDIDSFIQVISIPNEVTQEEFELNL